MPQPPLKVCRLGRVPYTQAWELMRGLATAKADTELPDFLLLLEHAPVITLGRRGTESDLKVAPEALAEKGVELFRVERGGLATYHGPGQLVAYPILDLARLGLGIEELVTRLEQVVIDLLADHGLDAGRKKGQRGVWMGQAKIASVGLAVKKNITMHGVAVNYAADTSGFDLITPCGLTGVTMTSVARQSGKEPDYQAMVQGFEGHFAKVMSLSLDSVDPRELNDLALARPE